MKRYISIALVLLGLMPVSSFANSIGFGFLTANPSAPLGEAFAYGFTFVDDFSSDIDVTGILVDGSTATSRPLTWGYASEFAVSAGAGFIVSTSGIGTDKFEITVVAGTFDPGEYLFNDAFYPLGTGDGKPVPAIDLLGVEVTFTFSDASTWVGVLSDVPPPAGSPFPNGIAYLVEKPMVTTSGTVPAPSIVWLVSMGLVCSGCFRTRFR